MNSDTSAFSVGALIDERPLSSFQILVVALCGLIMVLDGFDALCMGFLAPAIADDLGLPLPRFGPVFAASLFGLMLAALASGPIADLIALLAFACDSFALTLVLALIMGLCVSGAQAGLNGLAASFYPTSIRATGVGWASGIGRIGSIIGPTLGGALLSMQWTPRPCLRWALPRQPS
jgi:AAHS family 4-hydroxybenzoate transporter-like MFS transporter